MENSKIRIVLASHGEQSQGMLNTIQMLLGQQENIAAYSLYPQQTVNDLTDQLKKDIETYGCDNTIFMTEIKHGSPFNAVVSLTQFYDLYHISGTNTAMLATAIMERDMPGAEIEAVCDAIIEASKDSIVDVRKMLAAADDEDEEDF